MTKYKYAGAGVGVAGLPSEVTEEEAQELGAEIEQVLAEAILCGNYVCIEPEIKADHPRIVKKATKEQEHGQ